MPITLPDLIARYFNVQAEGNIDDLLALFTDDATVVDEGTTRHGREEIRAWRNGPATAYTYTTELHAIEQLAPDHYIVAGRLTGNFPSGTADLHWDFTIANNHITRLVIAP